MLATILTVFCVISVIISTILIYSCCVVGSTASQQEDELFGANDCKAKVHVAVRNSNTSRPTTQHLGGFAI